jgi:hypothetical protein
MAKQQTPEFDKFTDRVDELIKSDVVLDEKLIEELTDLYVEYLESMNEYTEAIFGRKAFKLGLIFATKINLSK